MVEIIVFLLALGLDQAVKYWSMAVLSNIPSQVVDVVPGVFWFRYAENHADAVSFIRGRSMVMNIVRLLQLLIILYLLIAQRKNLKPITRMGLVLFLAGMLGNQINYFAMGFVPDMLVLGFISRYTFNVADIFVVISMIILMIRLIFFEGHDLTNWILGFVGKTERIDNQSKNEPIDSVIEVPDKDIIIESSESEEEGMKEKDRIN